MVPPTAAQQRGIAYGPMPFAAVSFLSSAYVIHHLLCREPQKRKRMYHRLVLAMNLALLPLSLANALSTLAVPEGTPYYVGAVGTVNTCTAQGFIKLMFSFTVSTYYASLVLQAFLGIRNNFKEERYRWVEVPIHLVAYCVPCAYATVIAATNNFNPSGSGCFYAKAPRGCESDPDAECERGEDVTNFAYVVGFSHFFVYFVVPTLAALAVHLRMERTGTEASERFSGMSVVREKARRETTRRVGRQVSVYLVSFWITWVLALIGTVYREMTGDTLYDLTIVANCLYSLQGFVFMAVYFALPRMGGERRVGCLHDGAPKSEGIQLELTVSDIRSNVQRKIENGIEGVANNEADRFSFNIFDGEPDPDSPFAQFFYQDNGSDEEDAPDEKGGGVQPLSDEEIELECGWTGYVFRIMSQG